MYQEEDLVRIAKRENNNKRSYLVVNRLQGKHIPVKPHEALAMFKELAAQLKECYAGERLLLIGFAETATAIGAAVAAELRAPYMQTTREAIPGVTYLYFSEEHSHATEQKLVKDDIDSVIDIIDRIVFIEDEVTTGKTIVNIVNILEKQYPVKVAFAVASLLNGMDETSLANYRDRNIALFWLVKTNHAAYTEIADTYKGDGTYIDCSDGDPAQQMTSLKTITTAMMNARRFVGAEDYGNFCGQLFQTVLDSAELSGADNILVLGTEEFMYPALFVAERLEAMGKKVRFHATTRSPIAVSTEEQYPLHTRYQLKSLYDKERTTFVYDLDRYDRVLIITDADCQDADGVASLIKALTLCGNTMENIILIKKRPEERK